MTYRVVVVGATGAVGREVLNILHERQFPINNLEALASENSVGKEVAFGEKKLTVKSLKSFDFSGWDLALFAAGTGPSSEYAPKAAKADCIVIDNSSHWRMDPEVPLIVPEVNASATEQGNKKNIIANPNCSNMLVMRLDCSLPKIFC